MTPPSLTVAREILVHAAADARANGINESSGTLAAAIDVVLAALDGNRYRLLERMEPIPALEPPAATTHGTAIPPGALVADMLPCPFCSSTALTVGVRSESSFPRVMCGECGTRGPLARSTDNREAIANWNRRPATAAEPNALHVARAAAARLHEDAKRWITEIDDRPNLRAANARIGKLVKLIDDLAADLPPSR